MDVEDTGHADAGASTDNYQVKWAKVLQPKIFGSMTEAATAALAGKGSNIKVLWQTAQGNHGFGLYQYEANHVTYVTGFVGEKVSGYWDIPDADPSNGAMNEIPKKQLEPFNVINWGASYRAGMGSYLVVAGIATNPSVRKVMIEFSDGVRKIVPVHNGAFGVARTFLGNQGSQVQFWSAKQMGPHGGLVIGYSPEAIKSNPGQPPAPKPH